MANKILIAFVGMPGSGKTEAVSYLKFLSIPFVRFGQFTEDKLKEMGQLVTPENEKQIREKLRLELGMEAYAVLGKPRIEALLTDNPIVAIDGLYSWEEYVFLKKAFPKLTLIYIFARPSVRYERLGKRKIRPFSEEEARLRDVSEIENLNKGGPIAMADFVIDNSEDDLVYLHQQIDLVLEKLV